MSATVCITTYPAAVARKLLTVSAAARPYFAWQQQQPPQSSPLQQHFSQQQLSPQQLQRHSSAWAAGGRAFRDVRRNGKAARTNDENFI